MKGITLEKVETTTEKKVPFYKSKVFWAALSQVAAFFVSDELKEWLKDNPEFYVGISSLAVVILRNYTAGRIKWLIFKK